MPDWARALEQMRRVLKPGGSCCSVNTARRPMRGCASGRSASIPCGARWRVAAISTATSPSSSGTPASISSGWRRAIYRKSRGFRVSISRGRGFSLITPSCNDAINGQVILPSRS
ncbi:hypothetical protein [Billgrantia desiderata]|uniref:hypothetical protein n=1 Tax=Billgrantia desiderata TaxID=52021 RepID=UPI003BEF0650